MASSFTSSRRLIDAVTALAAMFIGLALATAPLSLAAQSIETVDPNAAIEEVPGDAPIYGDAAAQAQQVVESTAQDITSDAADAVNGATSDASEKAQAAANAANAAGQNVSVGDWSADSFGNNPTGGSGDPIQGAQGAGYPFERSQSGANSAGAVPASTYGKDDLIGAASGVFGKGAEGLARMIEGWLEKQGEPNAYIVGREGGGAFVVGARYGSGTLYHKVEGQRPVYWTGPSIGLDAGANAGSTFILVYNLHDSQDLYSRFPQGEGQVYVVGGLTASYLRKGNIVLIPIRMGAGLRLGVNAGYLRFSEKQRWLPF